MRIDLFIHSPGRKWSNFSSGSGVLSSTRGIGRAVRHIRLHAVADDDSQAPDPGTLCLRYDVRVRAAALLMVFAARLWCGEAEARALAWLAREVPAWHSENRCFSCHNNGDGARALYAARRLGRPVPEEALRATSAWLARPSEWGNHRGDPRFSDEKLARLQFTAALGEAAAAGLIADRAAVAGAAARLLDDQQPDGSWRVDEETAAGSPVTWGGALATAMARRVLDQSGGRRFAAASARAAQWLRAAPLRSVPDAAAILWALGGERPDCLAFLRRARASDGGWGPAVHAPAEPFDTALVLLALDRVRGEPGIGELIERGREWLARNQLDTGGWRETTRPPGGQSYAQHVSTVAWAALALLETAP
jgi:hypothetical protein